MKIMVVIPAYKVKKHILSVLADIGPEVCAIFVVDDFCPEESGLFVQQNCLDKRVKVISHQSNSGVGGATLTGYKAALQNGAEIIVKIDGDGQMDPAMLRDLVRLIEEGKADYTKGNRFFFLKGLQQMPGLRLLGNSGLSFLSKFSTGYWNIFDPTNGYTAIQGDVAALVCCHTIDKRYFFESDLLFRLYTLGAVVIDVPMDATYDDEESNLNIIRALPEFAVKHLRNVLKRIFYCYFLRDFSVASLELCAGMVAIIFGGVFGLVSWQKSIVSGIVASSGTVMTAALPVIIGLQLILSFLSYDVSNVPRLPLHTRLALEKKGAAARDH